VDHAIDGEVMLAYEMNGEDLPMLNGFPLRLVVPGYYGTYWVKHVNELTVIDSTLENYWMKTAYRIPNDPGACLEPGTKMVNSVPINRYNVRSFITSLADGQTIKAGQTIEVRGIAFDGGSGISKVLFTEGRTNGAIHGWARIGQVFAPGMEVPIHPAAGNYELKSCATNRIGESQPADPLWNRRGTCAM